MTESAQIGVPTHLRPMGPSVIADLDTLLIALYVELTDRIIPARSRDQRRGPGRPSKVTDTELVCLAVAQVLLRYHDEHRWLRAAPSRVGTCSPGCCLNRLATGGCDIWPGCWRPPCGGWPTTPPDTAELLRLLAGTPVGAAARGPSPCARRLSAGSATVTGFGLVNSKLVGERQAVVACSKLSRPTGRHPARCWLATRALPAATSRPPWPTWSWPWCARPAPTSPTLGSSRTDCGSGSRRSSGRGKCRHQQPPPRPPLPANAAPPGQAPPRPTALVTPRALPSKSA
jgi:hypothetical protein